MTDATQEKDCTPRCRSVTHAKLIQSCAASATPSQIRAYSVWLCHNFPFVIDEFGRNLLHIASSCGKYEIVEWLLKHCNVEVDVKDHESGWTALHRSFFYGQLSSARLLCMYGASLRSIDHDGLTPIDLIFRDRLPYIEYLPADPSDVYAWGSNFNYNLGLGNSHSRDAPEILEVFRKEFIDIKQVQICKFHSVFLTNCGRVYTCGYGHGGRLGQDTEDISLVPTLVKGMGSNSCTQVAAGQDHTLLLLQNGQILSCGLNAYHQLGQIPPCEKLVVPKAIPLKFLKGKKVTGIRAARFHSLIFTQDCVYTFGLNAGQLGHPKGNRTEIHPRQVSGLYAEDSKITHVEISDGATVCATNRGDVYVLHEYQIRKIASRLLDIKKLSVVGGHLDSRVDVAGVREGGGLELRVALLTKSGKVYLWRQTDPYLRRCLFTSAKEILVSDIHINHHSVGLITYDYEGYLGHIIPFKGKRNAPQPIYIHACSNYNKPSSGLVVLLDTDECHFIKVKKLPNIYRATSITSDSKGRNFAILQSDPKIGLIEIPYHSNSRMSQDFGNLLSESNINDNFHDVILKVGKKEFPSHRYILASRSDYFKKIFMKDSCNNGIIVMENTKFEAFEQILKFIYSNTCDFFTNDYEVKWALNKESEKKKKSSAKSKIESPIVILQELSRKFGLSYLTKKLNNIKLVDNRIYMSEIDHPQEITFKRHLLSNLSDITLISSDGIAFPCHKCILVARLDYFHSMLSSCWAEDSQNGQISLPIPSKILGAILTYLYSDIASEVFNSEDVEFVCQTLMFADQLLMTRFKEMCECSLARLITLKNCGELLEISAVYNAMQLKKSCMHFICINLAAVIESKVLEVVSEEVIEELSAYYRSLSPLFQGRKMSFSSGPLQKDLIVVEQQFPVSDTFNFEKNKFDFHETKVKNRRRCSSLRSEVKKTDNIKEKIYSEEFNENIVLDIITPDTDTEKLINKSPKDKKGCDTKAPDIAKSHKQGQWILHVPNTDQILSLNTIMQEEKMKLTTLNKKSGMHDMKPIPHLSQKQKKMAKQKNEAIVIPNSPPSQSSCPWAKLSEQSPPSPSFWDSLAKKEFPQSPLNRCLATSFKVNEKIQISSPASENDIVISLHDIQKAEVQKLQSSQVKSLHLINIEDQAIEELSVMYNVHDNHKEKITVSRVQSEVADPVWRRKH